MVVTQPWQDCLGRNSWMGTDVMVLVPMQGVSDACRLYLYPRRYP